MPAGYRALHTGYRLCSAAAVRPAELCVGGPRTEQVHGGPRRGRAAELGGVVGVGKGFVRFRALTRGSVTGLTLAPDKARFG